MNAVYLTWAEALERANTAAAESRLRHKVRRSRFAEIWIVAELPGQPLRGGA